MQLVQHFNFAHRVCIWVCKNKSACNKTDYAISLKGLTAYSIDINIDPDSIVKT